jgi:serine/threonine protein phosphatase 1
VYPIKRLLVISDVHGQIDSFNQLLEKVKYNEAEDLLFLLGDYVDRGKDPKACVQKARVLEKLGAIVLKGNHEDMMENALTGSGSPEYLTQWVANGGARTLKSYGVDPGNLYQNIVKGSPQLPDELLDDLEWISKLNVYAQTEHYIFVHAGVDPEKKLEETDEETFLWIRTPFFNGYHGKKTVIFGHTPTMFFHNSNHVYFGNNNIIGIDGGCVFGGQLNCLELPTKSVCYVSN